MQSFTPTQLISLIGIPPLHTTRSYLRTEAILPAPTSPFKSNAELQGFHQRIDAYLSLFAPIRRVPDDILREIFRLHAESLPKGNGNERTSAFHGPVRDLSHVCARWRAVVLDSPALWTHIDLRSIALTKASGAVLSGLTSTVLQNSRGVPLDVRAARCSLSMLAMLPMYLQRAGRLHVTTLEDRASIQYFSAVCVDRVPVLRQLRVAAASYLVNVASDLHMQTLAWTADALLLKRLSVSGSLVLQIPMRCLERLEELTCTTYLEELNDSLVVLESLSPHVHYSLVFYPARLRVNTTLRITPTTSNITHLTISAGALHDSSAMEQCLVVVESALSTLALPALEVLTFAQAPGRDGKAPLPLPWSSAAFTLLSSRSNFSAHLLSLDLVGVDMSTDDLLDCMRQLASLAILAIADPASEQPLVSTSLLQCLCLPESTNQGLTTVTPSLSQLNIHSCRLEFRDWEFVNFLQSRAGSRAGSEGPFGCHVYAAGEWTAALEIRRKLLMDQVQDLREGMLVRFSFSSQGTFFWGL